VESKSSFTNLREELKKRIVLKDGAIGTMLQETPAGRNVPILELLNAESPDVVLDLHLQYLDAGAEIITTNSFSGHPVELKRCGLESRTYELNFKAAELARSSVEKSGRRVFIAGSIGPTSVSLLLSKGEMDFDALKDGYKIQARALIDGGADYLLIETIHDPLNAKAASIAVLELVEEGYRIEIALSMTVNLNGISISGQTVSSFVVSSYHLNPLYSGLNCSLGPESLRGALEDLHLESPFPVAVVPNAGLPDECGKFKIGPDEFARQISLFLEKGWVNIIGGCCGTTPAHIRALKNLKSRYEPREYRGDARGKIAGLDSVDIVQVPAPFVVGERANTLGSRKFKSCVEENNRDKVIEIIRDQEHTGAHGVDICFASRDYDEARFWKNYAPSFASMLRAPVFIDTTNIDVLKAAFKLLPGKPVINSVNLEDGGEHIKEIGNLIRTYPAKVIAGLISPKGMAKTLEEKLETADAIYKALISSGISPCDIILDPLVFPVSTGVHPQESIKALDALKREYPESHTVLGISNISFGLPQNVRGILNSIYLKMALDAGLDIAILNVNELTRGDSVEDDIFKLAWKALSSNDQNALGLLIDRMREIPDVAVQDYLLNLDPQERLETRIIRGMRDGIDDDIALLMSQMEPMEIINGPLMKSMDKVSEMFGNGKMIISEVLLSAEVFRDAMTKLISLTGKSEMYPRGKIILATVKGDVHDIGKNLVGMVLESHGFGVIDLGTQVPPEELVDAVHREKPMAVGLSGLLIRSAYIMRETAEIFSDAGIDVPIVIGGAALSRDFTRKNIEPAYRGRIVRYAKDVLDGLRIFKEISDGTLKPESETESKKPEISISARKTDIVPIHEEKPPQPPDFKRHIINPIPIDDVIPHLNWKSLIKKHMGAKGAKEIAVRDKLEKALQQIVIQNMIKPKAIFAFFRAYSNGDEIVLTDSEERELGRIGFKRSQNGLCASDWIRKGIDAKDNIALMVATSGSVRDKAREFREKGDLFFSYALESVSLEIAEASASWVHALIRGLWDLKDKTRGERLSPGYPSMPDLEMQKVIFELLTPSDIGVSLTDELMMNPEASVSAIVFHHPDARHYI